MHIKGLVQFHAFWPVKDQAYVRTSASTSSSSFFCFSCIFTTGPEQDGHRKAHRTTSTSELHGTRVLCSETHTTSLHVLLKLGVLWSKSTPPPPPLQQHWKRYNMYTYRSIRCTSQNTETVIQTFRQPTAAFISEYRSSEPGRRRRILCSC